MEEGSTSTSERFLGYTNRMTKSQEKSDLREVPAAGSSTSEKELSDYQPSEAIFTDELNHD